MKRLEQELNLLKSRVEILEKANETQKLERADSAGSETVESQRNSPRLKDLLRRVVSPRASRRRSDWHLSQSLSSTSVLTSQSTSKSSDLYVERERRRSDTAICQQQDLNRSPLRLSSVLSSSSSGFVEKEKSLHENETTQIDAKLIYIGKLIGQGGLASVFNGNLYGFSVAVKVYSEEFGKDSMQKRNILLRKLNAIAALDDHPHIVHLFGNRMQNYHLVSTMELMECSLKDLIDARKKSKPSIVFAPFQEMEIITVMKHCAKALSYIHMLPGPIDVPETSDAIEAVWHRDIKPANIMARTNNGTLESMVAQISSGQAPTCEKNLQNYTFALADWDEAKVLYVQSESNQDFGSSDSWEDTRTLTRAASSPRRVAHSNRRVPGKEHLRHRLSLNVGTIQYMAPELLDPSTDTYDHKVDIWSLGMVLYEMLTLETPYAHDDVDQFSLSDRVESGLRPEFPKCCYLSNINKSNSFERPVWDRLLALYEKCTESNPAERCNAAFMLQALYKMEEYLNAD